MQTWKHTMFFLKSQAWSCIATSVIREYCHSEKGEWNPRRSTLGRSMCMRHVCMHTHTHMCYVSSSSIKFPAEQSSKPGMRMSKPLGAPSTTGSWPHSNPWFFYWKISLCKVYKSEAASASLLLLLMKCQGNSNHCLINHPTTETKSRTRRNQAKAQGLTEHPPFLRQVEPATQMGRLRGRGRSVQRRKERMEVLTPSPLSNWAATAAPIQAGFFPLGFGPRESWLIIHSCSFSM